jgi:hypothetical protein
LRVRIPAFAVAVHQIQHAIADALDDGHVDCASVFSIGRFGAAGDRLLANPEGGFLHADRKATSTWAMLGSEIGGERVRILIDQEIDPALPIHGNGAVTMTQCGRKAELLEQGVQVLRFG